MIPIPEWRIPRTPSKSAKTINLCQSFSNPLHLPFAVSLPPSQVTFSLGEEPRKPLMASNSAHLSCKPCRPCRSGRPGPWMPRRLLPLLILLYLLLVNINRNIMISWFSALKWYQLGLYLLSGQAYAIWQKQWWPWAWPIISISQSLYIPLICQYYFWYIPSGESNMATPHLVWWFSHESLDSKRISKLDFVWFPEGTSFMVLVCFIIIVHHDYPITVYPYDHLMIPIKSHEILLNSPQSHHQIPMKSLLIPIII